MEDVVDDDNDDVPLLTSHSSDSDDSTSDDSDDEITPICDRTSQEYLQPSLPPPVTTIRNGSDSEREPKRRCVFAFNSAIILSLVLITLEAICYDVQLHAALELYFYSARLVYYSLLLAATVTAAVIASRRVTQKVSENFFYLERDV